MSHRLYSVLFLCTGNSARSLMAESLLRYWGGDRFRAYSAGSHPKGEPHPMALDILRRLNLPTEGLRSKSWDEFAQPDAPKMDFVFTVCDRARAEVCPIWPGQPMTAHWGVEDPVEAEGSEQERLEVFHRALRELENRIKTFASLRIGALDRLSLLRQLEQIGRTSLQPR